MTVSYFTTRRLPGLSYTTSVDAARSAKDWLAESRVMRPENWVLKRLVNVRLPSWSRTRLAASLRSMQQWSCVSALAFVGWSVRV